MAESVRENISRTSLRPILRKDLGTTPYKVQLIQELEPSEHPLRFCFVRLVNEKLHDDVDFAMVTS